MKSITKSDITAVILSGGQATRMNGKDKGLVLFKDKPLISYVVNTIHKNVDSILVSANKNLDLYQKFGKVITDDLANFQGPLAGISKAIDMAHTQYLLVLPCDGPFIHSVLLKRLTQSMQQHHTDICIASDGDKIQPTFALINTNIKNKLDQYLARGNRKLGQFFKENKAITVDFCDHPKMFINLNSPEDLSSAS